MNTDIFFMATGVRKSKLELLTGTDKKSQLVDGKNINMTGLIKGFQAYCQQNCKIWLICFDFKEEGPRLVFHAFLQKIANGTAIVQREQAFNKGRVDVCVSYKDKNYPIELKVAGNTLQKPRV